MKGLKIGPVDIVESNLPAPHLTGSMLLGVMVISNWISKLDRKQNPIFMSC